MSDDLNQGVVVPGETTPPANTGGTVDRVDEPIGGDHDDVQSRARAMGWVPKEQFRGPAENWRDADEFVRRGEEELPILRERTRAMTREIESMKRDFDSRITMLTKTSAVALQRQREELEAAYDNAMRQATATGDVERFDQLNRDKRQAIYNHDMRVRDAIEGEAPQRQQQYQAPQQQGQQRPLPPEVVEWIDRNPWFNRDDELQAAAAGYSRKLERERPHLTLHENLAATERYIKEQRYADRFGGAQRGAQVESGSRVPSGGNTRRMGAGQLPPEARQAAQRFIQQGLYKSMDDYAKVYFEQEGA